MDKNFRIACYGFVKKGGSSITGAHFLILEELLKKGYEIDFYGKKNFSYPQELCKYNNFELLNIRKTLIKNIVDVLLLNFPVSVSYTHLTLPTKRIV